MPLKSVNPEDVLNFKFIGQNKGNLTENYAKE